MSDDDKQRLIADLEDIAASSLDPTRAEVKKIIECLSNQWPDDAELMCIRLRYSDESK
jgi:hypothetical protein